MIKVKHPKRIRILFCISESLLPYSANFLSSHLQFLLLPALWKFPGEFPEVKMQAPTHQLMEG